MKWLNYYKMRLVVVGCVAVAVLGGDIARADFVFGEPTNLGPSVNTAYRELHPDVSSDGLSLYFTSDRPGTSGERDIWIATRATPNDDWGIPVNLGPPVNSPFRDYAEYVSADGLELYFTSVDRPGGFGWDDIWVTRRQSKEDVWGEPVNIGSPVNTGLPDYGLTLSADELELYFNSNGHGGFGGHDIFVARRATVTGDWGAPVNLGPVVNSPSHDLLPTISTDGLCLIFSEHGSAGPYRPGGFGGADIWMTTRPTLEGDWGPPVNLGPTVNSSSVDNGPYILPDGSTLYFSSSRPGGFGDRDLWQAPIIPIVDFNGDGIVDSADMCIIVGHWGENYSLCDIGPTPLGDGIVDVQDLTVLAEHLFEDVDDPTLIAHWPLDESQGIIAYDNAAERDGTLIGGPVWQPDGGAAAGALQFDGTDDYVATDPVLNPPDGVFSVLAWIKGGAPGQAVLSQADGSSWWCTDSIEGCLMTELKASGRGAAGPLVSQIVITDGEWHRIGLVWDGSCRHLYVDGVEVAKDAAPLSSLEDAYGGLYFGAGSTLAPGTFFSGLIDDVRIYNRVVAP